MDQKVRLGKFDGRIQQQLQSGSFQVPPGGQLKLFNARLASQLLLTASSLRQNGVVLVVFRSPGPEANEELAASTLGVRLLGRFGAGCVSPRFGFRLWVRSRPRRSFSNRRSRQRSRN